MATVGEGEFARQARPGGCFNLVVASKTYHEIFVNVS